MDKPGPTLEIGKLYIHEERYAGKTRRLSVFEPIKLIRQSHNAMYGTDPNVDHEWSEYYEILDYFRYADRNHYHGVKKSKERQKTLRNQETVHRAELLEDNKKYFFDKLFQLKENLVET